MLKSPGGTRLPRGAGTRAVPLLRGQSRASGKPHAVPRCSKENSVATQDPRVSDSLGSVKDMNLSFLSYTMSMR